MEPTAAFAAFRAGVLDDRCLMMRLRLPLARDAFVAQTIAIGAECGFIFDAATVRAALRAGEERWLMLGADVV